MVCLTLITPNLPLEPFSLRGLLELRLSQIGTLFNKFLNGPDSGNYRLPYLPCLPGLVYYGGVGISLGEWVP